MFVNRQVTFHLRSQSLTLGMGAEMLRAATMFARCCKSPRSSLYVAIVQVLRALRPRVGSLSLHPVRTLIKAEQRDNTCIIYWNWMWETCTAHKQILHSGWSFSTCFQYILIRMFVYLCIYIRFCSHRDLIHTVTFPGKQLLTLQALPFPQYWFLFSKNSIFSNRDRQNLWPKGGKSSRDKAQTLTHPHTRWRTKETALRSLKCKV